MRKIFAILLFVIFISGCTSQSWEIRNKSDQKYGIFLMDSDGSGVEQVFGSGLSLSSASVSPDGSLIIFDQKDGRDLSNINTYEIALIKADGSGYRKLTDNSWMDFQPRWSTDGRILFVSDGGKKAGTDIYVMNTEGSVLSQLTDTPGISEADPDWKCGKIVFTRNYSIWIMNDDGTDQRAVTDPSGKGTSVGAQFPMGDYDPNLSPDCSKVVFERLTGSGKSSGSVTIGDYNLYVLDLATKTETDISMSEDADFVAKWGPDGKIIFIHVSDNPQDAYDIYVTNPDGTGRKKVTGSDPPEFVENGCSWSGNRILFTAEWFQNKTGFKAHALVELFMV